MKKVGSDWGNDMVVGARSSVLDGGGVESSRYSWGWESMSTVHPQTTPSVDAVKILCAFWVPMIEMLYTGCVCPEPVRGVFCTGAPPPARDDRVSQSKTCPEYDPPTMRLGWNGENLAVKISEVEWNTYSGRECKCWFQTWTRPSGS